MPQMAPQMATQQPQQNPMAGQDPDKIFTDEAENLELVQHDYILTGVEERLVSTTF
jgi:ER membrane protein complex subunit 3